MKILHLKERIPWFGGHSGYELLTRHLTSPNQVWIVKMRRGLAARYVGSAYARLHGRMGRGTTSLSEMEFRIQRRLKRPDACHILNLENNISLLSDCPARSKDIIGTVHLPGPVWKEDQCELLRRLKSAIALYQRDIPFFERYLGKGNVHFVHHGVDTDFFKPDAAKVAAPPRILYSGVYLRNEPMLARVVANLLQKLPQLRFDLLVPTHHRKSPGLAPLVNHPSVEWHAGLNDDQLRDLYQRAFLLLLPMNDSGANTAVVEALSSGLPVVTTDVGGIRDYGGGGVFPIVANNDDTAMAGLVERYCSNPGWRMEVARQCRLFAEQTLSWPTVAQRHLEAYRKSIA